MGLAAVIGLAVIGAAPGSVGSAASAAETCTDPFTVFDVDLESVATQMVVHDQG